MIEPNYKICNKLNLSIKMSSLQSLGISGIRGYTPDTFQMIEFMKPLTLIWGKNGSGKTVSFH